MTKHDRHETLDHRRTSATPLWRLGLWMRASFAGAAIAVAGVASLIDPPEGVPLLTALTWILGGGTFAWLSWQRTAALLDRLDRPSAVAQRGSGAASALAPARRVPNPS